MQASTVTVGVSRCHQLPDDEDHWLDPDMTELEEIVSLLRPYPAELLDTQPARASLINQTRRQHPLSTRYR